MAPRIKAVIFDMDGTVTYNNDPVTSWEILGNAANLSGQWSQLKQDYNDSNLNMIPSNKWPEFFEKSCKLLAGKPVQPVLDALFPPPYTPGFQELCAYLRKNGVKIGLVSYGVRLLGEKIQEENQLDAVGMNVIKVVDGLFTGEGKLRVPFPEKGDVVRELCEYFGTQPTEVSFIGDSPNDRSAWETVALPLRIRNSVHTDNGSYSIPKEVFDNFNQVITYFKENNLI